MDDKKVFLDYIKPVSDNTFERLYPGVKMIFAASKPIDKNSDVSSGFIRRIVQYNKAKKFTSPSMKEFVRGIKWNT